MEKKKINTLWLINFEALFKMSYGLFILSSGYVNKGNGFDYNSLVQVTAEPPQIASGCNKDNYATLFIQKTGAYSFSVLHQNGRAEIIGNFGYRSGKELNKLEDVDFITKVSGVPIEKEDSIAFLECNVKQTIDVGTCLFFKGEVVSADVSADHGPLKYAYFRKVKRGIAPKMLPPISISYN